MNEGAGGRQRRRRTGAGGSAGEPAARNVVRVQRNAGNQEGKGRDEEGETRKPGCGGVRRHELPCRRPDETADQTLLSAPSKMSCHRGGVAWVQGCGPRAACGVLHVAPPSTPRAAHSRQPQLGTAGLRDCELWCSRRWGVRFRWTCASSSPTRARGPPAGTRRGRAGLWHAWEHRRNIARPVGWARWPLASPGESGARGLEHSCTE